MADNADYLKNLNRQYAEVTGAELFQYASHPTGSSTKYVFLTGTLTSLTDAEAYMRWALQAVREGSKDHTDISYGSTNDGRAES